MMQHDPLIQHSRHYLCLSGMMLGVLVLFETSWKRWLLSRVSGAQSKTLSQSFGLDLLMENDDKNPFVFTLGLPDAAR